MIEGMPGITIANIELIAKKEMSSSCDQIN